MRYFGISQSVRIFILILGISFCWGKSANSAEITAVDFNGEVIGQVISTGMVISKNGENIIGYITADSLIVNEDGEIIGGVVPQGVAIGEDNRPLGKINSDGIVRSNTGKPLGRALPNGLVLDNQYNVIGSILFPGLIYSAAGNTIGRLTGAGTYTNLDGNEIGFVSANGYAYRKSGEEYVLDGRLMSSKMVVSLNGDFMGSIAPSGKVINFEGKEIGIVHANEYIYDTENKIIGRVVKTGYAFALNGNYLGVIAYNGKVMEGAKEIARYRADGNIVNNENEVIGFAVSMSATVNDNAGRYLGRVLPKGIVANGAEIIGHVGAKGFVFDKDNQKIGQINTVGPVFNTLGNLSGQSMPNGSYISVKGSVIGRMRGNLAFDSNGMLVGGISNNMIAISGTNKALGIAEADGSVMDGADKQKVSPFGYLMTSDNKLNGLSQPLSPIYGLEGQVYSYVTPNGSLYRDIQDVKINANGTVIGKSGYIGSILNIRYAVGVKNQSLGIFDNNNIILSDKGEMLYKVTPGYYVVAASGKVGENVMPLRGFSGNRLIAVGTNGDLLGYANAQGQVVNLDGNIYGQVISGNYVSDNNNSSTGKLLPFTSVNNDKCAVVGILNGRGEVVNNRDVPLGRLLPNGQAVSDVGSYIGFSSFATGLVDFDGNYAGSIAGGKGLDYANKNLGCLNRQGIMIDSDNKWLFGAIWTDPVIDFENNIIGQVLENGSIADNNNKILGSIQPNGNAISKSKKTIGNVMRYKVAFKNDNTFLGMVQNTGQILNSKGENVGQINFDGSVHSKGDVVGFALYDFYVYDENFVTYGYILKDGTVLNMSGSKLGKMDRGFVVDRSGQVVARGNRDYTIRDASNNAVGELQIDGNVLDYNNQNIGYLADAGVIRNTSGDEIAKAFPLQYYVASGSKEPKNDHQDWADYKKVQIQEIGAKTKNKPDDVIPSSGFNRRVVGIALDPDGDILGSIYDDNKVYDDNGNQIGFRTADGMIVDMKYNPIGVEEIKNVSAKNMFVPAGTFGSGNAYGIGNKPSSLGPGGGYGAGERYDPAKASALNQLQNARRRGIQVGTVKSDIKVSSFTGYEENPWNNGQVSSWRVDMSGMILEDKPIPAVLARSVYASDGLGSNIPITAIVERNIFTEEGRNIIIPAGSRVIGSLGGESGSSGGNSGGAVKIGISWKRLIRPDGSSFKFGSAQTADAQGRAGAIGYLDEQLLKKYTTPMLMTAMESATSYMMAAGEGTTTSDSGSSTESSKSQAASEARQNFLEQMNNIFDEIMESKSNIRAVTYIPAGTRIIIFPNEDLWLNSEEITRKGGGSSGSGGYDSKVGLTTDPDKFMGGSTSTGGGRVSYNNETNGNIQPTGGRRRSGGNGGSLLEESDNSAARRRQQQMRQQNNGIPPSSQQETPILSEPDDDVPSLL